MAAAIGAVAASGGAAQEPTALNPLRTIDAASLKGFRERPLFSESRRAAQPPVEVGAPVAAQPAPPSEPSLRLLGVIEGPVEAFALVRGMTSNTPMQLRLGDMMDGWLVTEIGQAELRLTLGDRDRAYRLFDPHGSPESKKPATE